MSASMPQPPKTEAGEPSNARKATGYILLPYLVGAFGIWPGFPLSWNAFGFKIALILAVPAIAIFTFPMAQSVNEDKWQWPHFFATVVYLIVVSWLMFR